MIRVVLTVLVAVALFAIAFPALDDARTTTTVDRLDTQGERFERTAAGIAADSVAVADPTLAARATVTIRAPTGITAARIDRFVLGDPSNVLDGGETAVVDRNLPDVALVYWLAGDSPRVVPVTVSTSTASLRVVDDPIELRTGGRTRIELRLVDVTGDPTVRVARVR